MDNHHLFSSFKFTGGQTNTNPLKASYQNTYSETRAGIEIPLKLPSLLGFKPWIDLLLRMLYASRLSIN